MAEAAPQEDLEDPLAPSVAPLSATSRRDLRIDMFVA